MTATDSVTTRESPLAQATAVAVLLLAGLAFLEVMYVIPTFTAMMTGVGEAYSWPSRLALAIGRFGVPIVVLGGGALGWSWWRGRSGEAARRRFENVLAIALLVVTAYVALVAWVFVDAAIALPAAARG
jgi:hypothetical protein